MFCAVFSSLKAVSCLYSEYSRLCRGPLAAQVRTGYGTLFLQPVCEQSEQTVTQPPVRLIAVNQGTGQCVAGDSHLTEPFIPQHYVTIWACRFAYCKLFPTFANCDPKCERCDL
jgi:hypothetical protein